MKNQLHNDVKTTRLHLLTKISMICIAILSFNTVLGQEVKPQPQESDSRTSKPVVAENDKKFIVKGNVSEDNKPFPEVSVMLENTTISTQTDEAGNFEFPIKLKKGDVLVFSILGMDTKKVTISDKNSASQVVMQIDMDMTEIILMGDASIKGAYSSKKSN